MEVSIIYIKCSIFTKSSDILTFSKFYKNIFLKFMINKQYSDAFSFNFKF